MLDFPMVALINSPNRRIMRFVLEWHKTSIAVGNVTGQITTAVAADVFIIFD